MINQKALRIPSSAVTAICLWVLCGLAGNTARAQTTANSSISIQGNSDFLVVANAILTGEPLSPWGEPQTWFFWSITLDGKTVAVNPPSQWNPMLAVYPPPFQNVFDVNYSTKALHGTHTCAIGGTIVGGTPEVQSIWTATRTYTFP
jgi:hypothetical protein